MKQDNNTMQAFRYYHMASRAAKALRVAQVAAMGCAAASLVVGGARVVQRFREK